MDSALQFLVDNGYVVMFAVALVNQLGLPVPALPFLFAAGALARKGELRLDAVVGLAVAGSVLAHYAWYEAGRRAGTRILRLVCRISLEPDACVRKTEDLFARRGARALVFAYFVPGLVTVAQPLAGTLRMPRLRFLAFNLVGAFLWVGAFTALGFAFSRQLGAVAAVALELGSAMAVLLGVAVVAYAGWKMYVRWRLLGELRTARITPEELKRRLDLGEPVVIVDLRHSLELKEDPTVIPGALRIAPEELELRHVEIPRGGEIVLYCS